MRELHIRNEPRLADYICIYGVSSLGKQIAENHKRLMGNVCIALLLQTWSVAMGKRLLKDITIYVWIPELVDKHWQSRSLVDWAMNARIIEIDRVIEDRSEAAPCCFDQGQAKHTQEQQQQQHWNKRTEPHNPLISTSAARLLSQIVTELMMMIFKGID